MTGPVVEPELLEATVYSSDGSKVGSVAAVILDRHLREPEFLGVKRGLLGSLRCFLPVAGSRLVESGDLHVPFDLATIDAAPKVELHGGTFDEDQSGLLHRHFGTTGPAPVGDVGS